jgi:hypothetical protein
MLCGERHIHESLLLQRLNHRSNKISSDIELGLQNQSLHLVRVCLGVQEGFESYP